MQTQWAELKKIAASIGSSDSAEPLVELVRAAVEGARADGGTLYLFDESGKYLKPRVVCGLPPEYVAACGDVAVGTQCCGNAVLHKKPWFVTDMTADPHFAEVSDAIKKSWLRAAFSVPVVDVQGRVLGSLACHFKKPHQPTPYELERNHIFATLISFALLKEKNHSSSLLEERSA